MIGTDNGGPGLAKLLRKTLNTGMGALHNRGELFLIELQEEKSRLVNLVVRGLAALFLSMITVLLITGAVIFLVAEEYRVHAVGAFAVLYLAATLWAVFSIKAMLKRAPFGETLAQFKKDRELMESFE
jgi:uncharacterized membrane protein YqjE